MPESLLTSCGGFSDGRAPLYPAPVVGAPGGAHFKFTRTNIERIILPNQFEDFREVAALMSIAS